MFGFFCVSATVGSVIATSQVIAALAQAQDALPLNDVATVRTTSALQLQVPRRTFLTCLSNGFSMSFKVVGEPEQGEGRHSAARSCHLGTDVCAMQSLAVDLGAFATFAFLLRRDLKARDKQVRLYFLRTALLIC